MLRFFLLIISLISVFIGLPACCKQYCPSEEMVVRYIHFKNSDLDSVLFVGYQSGGSFGQPLDSFYHHTVNNPLDTTYDIVDHNVDKFSVHNDWKIKLLNVGREYRVSAIQTQKKSCNCGGNDYYQIIGYKLNDSVVNNTYIDLSK